MAYPPDYRPRATGHVLPPLASADPAICVCADICRAYENGDVTHAEFSEVLGEWLPRVPLGNAHSTFMFFLAHVMRDRAARFQGGAE